MLSQSGTAQELILDYKMTELHAGASDSNRNMLEYHLFLSHSSVENLVLHYKP